MIKADYHGALIKVALAVNQSLVGLTGIVVREKKKSFILITKKDEIKLICKRGTAIDIKLPHEGAKAARVWCDGIMIQGKVRCTEGVKQDQGRDMFEKKVQLF